MINYFNAAFLSLGLAIGLTSCGPAKSDAPKTPPPSAKPAPEKAPSVTAQPAVKPDYDFMRTLNSCVGYSCTPLAPEKMSVSDYNPALISQMGLTQGDTLAQAREKISIFYKGMVSSGLSGTTDPKLKLVQAQLSPGTQSVLPEYDMFIRTDGQHNGAKVIDWGARIRCAPVTQDTAWQTTPCNDG